jgi:hypothetical protein
MSVLAVDVGVKNLGLCVWERGRVTHWWVHSLVDGKYVPAQNVKYVCAFLEQHRNLFERASVVLIERQMRTNMRVIEALLEFAFLGRSIVLSPRSIKMHYSLCMRDYRKNKIAAVEFIRTHLTTHPQLVEPVLAQKFHTSRKQDDLADSLLMLLYYLDTYSNVLPRCPALAEAAST